MKRVASLDLLRGVAILGILFMNIVAFSMPEPAYINPNWDGGITQSDIWYFSLQYLLAKERFIALFCVLFGAGLVVFWQRAQVQRWQPFLLLRKRLLWLFAFGCMHMTLLFYGDILITYAICGFIIFKSVALDKHKLLKRGIIFVSVGMLIMMGIAALTTLDLNPDSSTSLLGYPYAATEIDRLISSATGSWFTMMAYNIEHGIGILLLWPILFWTIAGNMLLGMALVKMEFFAKGVSSRIELLLFLVGGCLSGGQLYMILSTGFSADFWLIAPFNTVGGLLIILAISSRLIKVVAQSPRCLMPLQYVGRMAFSLYILQSISMTLLFRVITAEHFGLWSLAELLQIAVVASVVQIVIACAWQVYLGQGPLEKLWRKLTYSNPRAVQASPLG